MPSISLWQKCVLITSRILALTTVPEHSDTSVFGLVSVVMLFVHHSGPKFYKLLLFPSSTFAKTFHYSFIIPMLFVSSLLKVIYSVTSTF